MLLFPNCKINLGLSVVEKRPDGFHNIETIFYPLGWSDALEVVGSPEPGLQLDCSGIAIQSPEAGSRENILFRAWDLLSAGRELPGMKAYLHKAIPMGAGLGGGSSDAAFILKMIDHKLGLQIPKEKLSDMAAALGSDCAFFMENKPVFATGKGEVFEAIKVDLSNYYILAVYPGINSNTKEAYDGVVPSRPERSVKEVILNEPLKDWKNLLQNDFEKSIFKKYPAVSELKAQLYDHGAAYASMSGSGSAVFGIFKEKPALEFPEGYLSYLQTPLR